MGEKMKTIGIVGTRSRDSDQDFEIVRERFKELYKYGDRICSGLCPKGADRFACILDSKYRKFLLKPLWFPADWDAYGKVAGFIRNTHIARESDILIACVSVNRKGGTEDTINKFIKFHSKDNLYIV